MVTCPCRPTQCLVLSQRPAQPFLLFAPLSNAPSPYAPGPTSPIHLRGPTYHPTAPRTIPTSTSGSLCCSPTPYITLGYWQSSFPRSTRQANSFFPLEPIRAAPLHTHCLLDLSPIPPKYPPPLPTTNEYAHSAQSSSTFCHASPWCNRFPQCTTPLNTIPICPFRQRCHCCQLYFSFFPSPTPRLP